MRLERGKLFVSATLLALVALSLSPGRASAVALTNIDQTTFDALTGTQVAALTSSFDFIPSNGVAGDGEIHSAVYEGQGDAAGLFVYVYQLVLFDTSSSNDLTSISFDFFGGAQSAGGLDGFYVGTNPTFPSPFVTGTHIPDDEEVLETAGSVLFPFFDGSGAGTGPIGQGEASFMIGLFSEVSHAIITSNVLDGTATIRDPNVIAPNPIPEPGSLLLLGSGLAGLGFAGRRRRMRNSASKV